MRRRKRIAAMHALTRLLSLVLCTALCLSALPARSLSVSESSRLCGHVCEDGTCGYTAGEEGTPCDHICHITRFDSYTPGTPIFTYATPDGASYADVLAALPATLPGRLSCAEGAFDIPVTWSCDAFTDASGVYSFRAALANAHCDYIVPDDPDTTDIDESVDSPYCDLPTADVTVASPAAPAQPPVVPTRGHVCEITGFTDFDPSAVFAIAQFDKGRTVEELYAEVLPKSLTVTYACSCADTVTVLPEESTEAKPVVTTIALPVTWECADFDPTKTGDYIFTVKALPAYPFTYLKQDDPATIDVNESLLPSILVRVYEPSSPTGRFTVCYGVLNSDRVHVRSGPGTIFESLAQLDTDTPVIVTGQCDHWYRVDIATWTGAFIDQSLITILEEQTEAAAPMTGKLNADEVKIRKGPDREYDIITVLPEGAPMTVLGRCGNWYFISTEDIKQGYVWREYVTIDPPVPVEGPACTCTEHCAGEHSNADCPVCAAHPDDCAVRYIAEGYPRMGRVNTENCEVRVGAATLHLHMDAALTLYNEADGLYEFSSDEIEKGFIATEFVTVIEYECTCTVPCTETTCNQLCPVCAAEGWGACAVKELSEQVISAVAEDGSTITISGSLPVGATVSVAVVPVETAAEFVAEGAEILFAYDIKILVAGVEWQPDEHVRVSITPPPETPIVSDVAVTHVAEDKDTGAVTTSTITDVSTTLSDEAAAQPGAVEFAAEGFSIFIGTTPPTEQSPTPTVYWNGSNFYTDEACTANSIVTDVNGHPYITLPALLLAIDGSTTVYMKAGYTVAGTQDIGNSTYAVTLMRHSSYFGALITVPSDASLTLASITINGGGFDVNDTAVLVNAGGTLVINDGTTIKNNHLVIGNENASLYGGGGVRVCGTASMDGGIIRENTVSWRGEYGCGGAGVAVVNGGTFTMHNGSISDNQSTTNAGGGGVLSRNRATFTMNGGSITSNSSMYGGAIYNYEGTTTTINGGTISSNTATKSGGGIYCAGNCSLNISGGLITGNSCSSADDTNGNGGAINVNSGTLVISGGSVYGNTCLGGYEVFRQGIQDIIITGGTISSSVYCKSGWSTNDADPLVRVYPNTITVPGIGEETAITGVDIKNGSGQSYEYGLHDVQTTNDGTLCFWLPTGYTVRSVTTSSGTITITSTTTVHATITPTSATVSDTLTAALLSGGTPPDTISHQWFRNGVEITGATGATYTTVIADVSKAITVQITGSDGNIYTSSSVNISVPQFSVSVPITMVVTVDATGTCTVNGGSIYNGNTNPVYVTNVSYAWITNGPKDANELFGNYTAVTAALTLGGTTYNFIGATPTAATPNVSIAAKVDNTWGSLPLGWAFTLGTGNYLKLAPAVGSPVHVATVTYTIEGIPPQTP